MATATKLSAGALPADTDGIVHDHDAALRRIDAAGRVRTRFQEDGVHPGTDRLPGLHAQGCLSRTPTSSRRRRSKGRSSCEPTAMCRDRLSLIRWIRGESTAKANRSRSILRSSGERSTISPTFLVSFRELGEMGIGKGRGRFQLTHVRADNGESIYDGDTQMVHNLDNARSFDDIRRESESQPTDVLTLRLVTPTRITHEGALTDKLPFHVFWRRLIGRISALAYFHCGESLEMDFKELIDKGGGRGNDGLDAAVEGLDAVLLAAGSADATRRVGRAR